ncbi:MAG: plasmid pRiA4b ORF-3 family protein [Verrucomicrobiota bacterium JB023]|nr:plasmid pRiA4b ORF-3 family protein [Verrucomicrobiota bacterium JB023]
MRYIVKIFLYQITPEIWRRLAVPADFTFEQFNDALQASLGWENKHPHEFRHGKGKRLVDVIGPVGLADQVPMGGAFQDEKKITLQEFIGRRRTPVRILFRYDFAEDWIHEIVFEKKDEGEGLELLEGERNGPPEDFGGAFRYMQALSGEIAWDLPGYDPEAFDPAAIDLAPKKKRKRRS